MIVILGAGLTGLSAAFHLKGGYQILEKEREAGGLCRSIVQDGFTFDYTGHLLHLKDPYTKGLIKQLLPYGFISHRRRASIYIQGRYVPYPFQANLWALPKEVTRECLLGFIRAHYGKQLEGEDLLSWIYQTFGPGIAKYFLVPYNEKLWQIPLQEISLEWVERFIPCPTLEEVIDGALGVNLKGFGYNQEFLYPRQGGIQALTKGFLSHIQDIKVGCEAVAIDIERKAVRFQDGGEIAYDALISTLPLDELLGCITSLPHEIADIKGRLRYVSVLNLNFGVNREGVVPYHWVYFPEPIFPFYRVGFLSNLSPAMVPKGTSSLSVEIAFLPASPPEVTKAREETLAALKIAGILRDQDEILTERPLWIRHAYVIFDRLRGEMVPRVISFLRSHSIYTIGRYGRWGYTTMEEAILEGREIAQALI